MRMHADPEKYTFCCLLQMSMSAKKLKLHVLVIMCVLIHLGTIDAHWVRQNQYILIMGTIVMIIHTPTDPTILIIIIICASGGLALMCITPIIILVTCFYYRRKKGDMKHSTSYDNLIPEEEPDIDKDMYKHLEEEDRRRRRGLGVDIERRISLLENEGLVDELSPTKKDTAMIFIDEVDEDKEKENNILQKLNPKKPDPIKSREKPEKPIDEGEKKDLSYIDGVEPKDEEKEKEDKQKSSDKAKSDTNKKSWLKKWNTKKPEPTKSEEKPEKPSEKEDLDAVEPDDKEMKKEDKQKSSAEVESDSTKKDSLKKWNATEKPSVEEKKDISYIDTVEPDNKPKNELKDKWQSAKQSSKKKDISYIDDVDEGTDDDKAKLLQKWNVKKPSPIKSSVSDDKKADLKHKSIDGDIMRRISLLQSQATK